MSRFPTDEPVNMTPSPTPTVHDEESPVVRDADSLPSEKQEKSKWSRWNIRPASGDNKDKVKKEKAEDVDYVEEVDGVWGKLGEGAPNYKNVGW